MKINLLDLFSGMGGFHLGLEKAGFKVNAYNSEIDKYAIDVYKHNFKNSTYVGSVTDVRGSELPRIDAITFGSPCQDFSIAGKRKGMGGNRSSLITEAIRLIDECRPRFFIWENVKGTFSSNNRQDFAAILQAFANIGGYRLEWQLLNTKWFLPQNRQRIYLVGYIAEGSRGQIFPIGQSSSKINELQRQQTNTLTARYAGEGQGSYIIERKFNAQEEITVGDFRNDEGYRERKDNNSPCLASRKHSETDISTMPPLINKIRRLTPIECERLQGFPDYWTKIGKELGTISDSQRYKMCGNAVTVDVVEAVAKQIIKTIVFNKE
jgi:DNA (cytosine-5)-methyltransferase 1